MVKCPYCKSVFAFENDKPGTQSFYDSMAVAGLDHAARCPKLEFRIRQHIKPYYETEDRPEYHDPQKRRSAAQNAVYTYCKVQQVEGSYSDKIVCGPKCMASKGPTCECSCGGQNHGKAWV